ncbi:glycosyltransferase family 4 protein [Candidatus Parcubacteria bacterium]|nr:glycosyltransferase family 4 protein [Candidatus Parcubacteria bacterium]
MKNIENLEEILNKTIFLSVVNIVMKIVQVNKFNYLRGGAEKCFLELCSNLEKNGNKVAKFCMHHPQNTSTKWDKFFVSRISYNESRMRDKLIAPFRLWYSLEAQKKFEKLIRNFKPDLIHIHNIFHQISPSILPVAKKKKIPVVMHLHDYKMLCPSSFLYSKDAFCKKCKSGKYFNCFLYKCHKESYLKSLIVTIEAYLHSSVFNIYLDNIDLFIAPSQFMKNTCVEFGLPENKIIVINNPISNEEVEFIANYKYKYLLYFGRLSREKGIHILLEAMAKIKTDIKLKIAGEGPEFKRLNDLIKQYKIDNKISFVGYKSSQELWNLIIGSNAVIIPSIVPENMPYSMMEAMAFKKVVIAANVGGIPEIIANGENGFLFDPNDIKTLVERIDKLNNFNLTKMGQKAWQSVLEINIENHYKDIIKVYKNLTAL